MTTALRSGFHLHTFIGFKLCFCFLLLTAAEEGETVGMDLGGIPNLIVLVNPFVVTQRTGNANLAALVKVFAEDLGQLAEGYDFVPVGPRLAVTVFVAVSFVGGQRKSGDGEARFGNPYFRSGAEVANEGKGITYLHGRHKKCVYELRWYSC